MTGPGKPDAAPEAPVTPQQSMLALLERDDAPAKPEPEKAETQEVEAEVSTEDVDSRETPEATEEPEIEPETEVDDVPEEEDGDPEAVYEVTVDGEVEEVTATELVKRYGQEKAFTQKSMALADERKSFDVEKVTQTRDRETLTQLQARVQEKDTRYDGLLERLEAAIVQQEGGRTAEEWAALQASDSTKYLVEKEIERDRQGQIEKVQAERQRVAQEQQQEFQQQLGVRLDRQAQAMVEKIPAWEDKELLAKEMQALGDFAVKQYGFTVDEFNDVMDHRNILMIRDAMELHRLNGKKPTVAKKTKAAPVAKPGPRKVPRKKVSAVETTREKLAESGTMRDATETFMAILNDEK